jgi:hypothetical protein
MEFDLVRTAAFAVQDKSLITINLAEHDATAKKMRAARDAANPAFAGKHPDGGPQEELRRLRHDLFNLTERAKSTEVYCNNQAGNVRLLEQQITDAIKQKKTYAANGNALAERNCEHTIARIEGEKAEAEKEFNRARKVSADAAFALKEWPHRLRLEELQKPLPDGK